ncbi:MAG: hypothetical protein GC202_09315 [Alphaproteobacteria bacterium]|nr:hypothetical protein [Alphaproteobacteria bacterium]
MGPFGLVVLPLRGLGRILRGERAGIDQIGSASRAGWILSFIIPAVLAAPAYAWMTLQRFAELEFEPASAADFGIEALGYVVGIVAFPNISYLLCERLGRREPWYDYVAAYNWATVPQIALYLPVALIGANDAVPGPIAFLFGVVAVIAAIAIHFRVARVVLEITPVQALLLVAVDLAIGQFIARIVDRLHGF